LKNFERGSVRINPSTSGLPLPILTSAQ